MGEVAEVVEEEEVEEVEMMEEEADEGPLISPTPSPEAPDAPIPNNDDDGRPYEIVPHDIVRELLLAAQGGNARFIHVLWSLTPFFPDHPWQWPNSNEGERLQICEIAVAILLPMSTLIRHCFGLGQNNQLPHVGCTPRQAAAHLFLR